MKNFNFILAIITIVILAIIGVAFIGGTIYSSLQTEDWIGSLAYDQYLENMNSAVLPLTIALIITLGLCIPKRLFSGQTLLLVNGFLLFVSLLAAIVFSPETGLGLLLAIAALMQIIVIVLTLSGSKRIHYEKTGFFLQIGSALLHLGLVIFMFDFMLMADSPKHLTIFWWATGFIGFGMVFSFYSQEFSKLTRRKQEIKSEAFPEATDMP